MAETAIDVKLDPRPANSGSEEVIAALREMVQEAKTASAATVQASDAMVKAFTKPAAPAKAAATGIAAAYKSLNDPFVHATDKVHEFTERFLTLKNAIVAGLFAELIHETVEVSTQLEGVQDRMEAITGSTAAATRELSFATQTAHDLGIQIIGTTDSLAKLTAATQGTALAGQKTHDIFMGVQEAAKALELSSQETEGVLDTMIGLLNRGEASSRQFQLMIGRQLPGSLQIAARSMGVTTDEFNRMLVRGEIVAEDLLPKFADELHKTFGEKAQQEASDLESNVDRLSDSFKNLVASVTNNDSTGAFFSLLNKFVSGLAIAAGNAQDPADRLNTEILKAKKNYEDLQQTISTLSPAAQASPAIQKQLEAYKKVWMDLAAQQNKTLGLGLEGATKPTPPPAPVAKLTTDQLQTITDLTNALDKQSKVFQAHAKYGYADAAAVDALNARFTLLGKGIKDMPEEVQAALNRADAARKKAAAADFNTSLKEDTQALRVQIAAGDDATQALTRYHLELEATRKGLNALDPEIQKNVQALLSQQATLASSDAVRQLQVQTEQFRLQAESIENANEVLEDYQRNLELRRSGVTPDERISIANNERKIAQNDVAIAQAEDELKLAGLSEEALNREMALRKLNSAATDEQKQKIEQLADAQYKQMNGFGAYSKRTFDEVDKARETTMENFVDSLANAAATGKFTWHSFAESVLTDLARIYARALIVNAVLAAFGSGKSSYGGGISTTPGAGGGAVTPGSVPAASGSPATLVNQDYLTGEDGPELIRFNRSAQIMNTRDTQKLIGDQTRSPIKDSGGGGRRGGDMYVTVKQENTIVTKGVTAAEVQAEVAKGVNQAIRASVVTVKNQWKNGRL